MSFEPLWTTFDRTHLSQCQDDKNTCEIFYSSPYNAKLIRIGNFLFSEAAFCFQKKTWPRKLWLRYCNFLRALICICPAKSSSTHSTYGLWNQIISEYCWRAKIAERNNRGRPMTHITTLLSKGLTLVPFGNLDYSTIGGNSTRALKWFSAISQKECNVLISQLSLRIDNIIESSLLCSWGCGCHNEVRSLLCIFLRHRTKEAVTIDVKRDSELLLGCDLLHKRMLIKLSYLQISRLRTAFPQNLQLILLHGRATCNVW